MLARIASLEAKGSSIPQYWVDTNSKFQELERAHLACMREVNNLGQQFTDVMARPWVKNPRIEIAQIQSLEREVSLVQQELLKVGVEQNNSRRLGHHPPPSVGITTGAPPNSGLAQEMEDLYSNLQEVRAWMAGEEAHRDQGCRPADCPVWAALTKAERAFDSAQGAMSDDLNRLNRVMREQVQIDGDRLMRLELYSKAELQDREQHGCCPPSCGIPRRVQITEQQLGLQGVALDDLQRYVSGLGESLGANLETANTLGQDLEGLKIHVLQMGSEAGPHLEKLERSLGGEMWGMHERVRSLEGRGSQPTAVAEPPPFHPTHPPHIPPSPMVANSSLPGEFGTTGSWGPTTMKVEQSLYQGNSAYSSPSACHVSHPFPVTQKKM